MKRMRLPASKFMSAMSVVLTSWSFTNTHEPWAWVAFSASSAWVITASEWPVLSAISTTKVGASWPPTRPGIKRMRLPTSKFMSAMSAALTSWSFTNTQEPWVWLAFSAISFWDIWTVEWPDASAISTSNNFSFCMVVHLWTCDLPTVYEGAKRTPSDECRGCSHIVPGIISRPPVKADELV